MKLRILKTYFSLLASTMAYMGKTDKKLKFLGNEKRYRDEIKSIFHIFGRLSNRKQYKNSRHEL